MMRHLQTLVDAINKGKAGFSLGLSTSIPNLDIYESHYYLIGAESGVGKTTLTDQIFLLEQLEHANNKWIYFNFEIPETVKLAEWLSYFIQIETKKIIDVELLLGYNKIMTPEEVEIVDQCFPMLESLMERVTLYSDPLSFTQIESILEEHAKTLGEFTYKKIKGINKIDTYRRDSDTKTIVIIDHIALIEQDNGLNTKMVIDKLSQVFTKFRNICGFTFVVIQQFNSELQNASRSGLSDNKLVPSREDFGDSKYPFRDADTVLGGVSPHNYHLKVYFNVPVTKETTCWHFLKTRYRKRPEKVFLHRTNKLLCTLS